MHFSVVRMQMQLYNSLGLKMMMSIQHKNYSSGRNEDQLDVSTISAHGLYAPLSDVIVLLNRLNRCFLILLHISHSLEA